MLRVWRLPIKSQSPPDTKLCELDLLGFAREPLHQAAHFLKRNVHALGSGSYSPQYSQYTGISIAQITRVQKRKL